MEEEKREHVLEQLRLAEEYFSLFDTPKLSKEQFREGRVRCVDF